MALPRFTTPRYAPLPTLRERECGPWVRVVEDRAMTTDARETLSYHENGYLADGRSRVRPSLALMGTGTGFTPYAGGAPIQGAGYARALSGAVVNYVVAAGRLFVGTGTVPATEVNLVAAGITCSAAARHVWAVSFADYLVFSDDTNRPFKLSLTTLAVTHLTYMTGAASGPPRVYYGKLFFIIDGDLIWSEEGDPDNGYEGPCDAGGNFNNRWTVRQTDQDPLEAILATNAALVYWRGNNVGTIQGAVTPEFQTDGTHDGISSALGTRSPGSPILAESNGALALLFVDQRGKLAMARLGAGAAQVSEPSIVHGTVQKGALGTILAAQLPELGLVLVAHPGAGTTPTELLVFDPAGPEGEITYQGRWTWPAGHAREIRAMGVWSLDARDDVETLVIGTELGTVFGFTPALPVTGEDYLAADGGGAVEGTPFTRTVTVGGMLAEPKNVKRFDLATLECADPPFTPLSGTLTFDYVTSAAPNVAPLVAAPTGTADGNLGVLQLGLDATGRWIRPSIRTTGADAAYDIVRLALEAVPLGRQTEAG